MTSYDEWKVLPSGARIPTVGLGVFQATNPEEAYEAVVAALALGYRHIDTARDYENEAEVGRAVRDSGLPRDQIFITSKLFPTDWGYDRAIECVRESNARIGLGYVDLFLLHAPGNRATRAETWRALEDLQQEGVVRDIGVSNFGVDHIQKLLETARVPPALNQIEVHPWLARPAVVQYCQANGIHIEAYSPLAKAKRLTDTAVQEIAAQVQATPGQVCIAWSLAKQFITLPKSFNPTRQAENLAASKVSLSPGQIARLDALDEYLVLSWDPIKDEPV
jgi:diketogulonate reductase-like aldo/keto reductase